MRPLAASRPPGVAHRRAERRSPQVLPDEHGSRAARLDRGGEVDGVLLAEHHRQILLIAPQLTDLAGIQIGRLVGLQAAVRRGAPWLGGESYLRLALLNCAIAGLATRSARASSMVAKSCIRLAKPVIRSSLATGGGGAMSP